MGIEFEEYSKQIEMEIGGNSKQTQIEIGESSKQTQEMTLQEELDFILARCDTIQHVNTNVITRPIETQLPVNLEPAIPEPIIHTQPLGMDE
ncbi:hypothetical protein Hanom_Chr06g00569781 [Helianthus anomalus]